MNWEQDFNLNAMVSAWRVGSLPFPTLSATLIRGPQSHAATRRRCQPLDPDAAVTSTDRLCCDGSRARPGSSCNADSLYGRFTRARGRRVRAPAGDGLPCELPGPLDDPGILSALSFR